ncbi:hypothetical protein AB0B88_15880 [Micromonospora haikouensis]|uniref:hypothetical protein n=1 Tax=Micromonospora haikouensis TaxID=686309 RepID=UPI0033C58DE9
MAGAFRVAAAQRPMTEVLLSVIDTGACAALWTTTFRQAIDPQGFLSLVRDHCCETKRTDMSILCPDGRKLTLSNVKGEFLGPWGFKLLLKQPSGSAFMSTGAVGSFEAVERHTGQVDGYQTREARYQGRALASYEDPKTATTTFLWLGQHHELAWTVGGRDVSFDVFAKLLSGITLDDSASGLRVDAKRGTGANVSMTIATNSLTNLCAVSVIPTDDPSVSVPTHAGKKVPGGILWRHEEKTADGKLRRTAVLASSTALTYLGFFEPDSAANAELAESIQVRLV